MIGPYEVIIFVIVCLVPIGIILGSVEIAKRTRRRDSVSNGSAGLAVASLVTGIISLFAWLMPIFGFPLSVVGLVFGIMSRNSSRRRMAIAGIVMSAIGLLAVTVNFGYSFVLNYD